MSRLDILIFGASGFTGKYTVKEIIKIANLFEDKFTWGVAGRNREKLRNVLEEQGKQANVDLSKIPIVIADITNEESLNEMAKQARVILNCCGPYRFYGEPVVKACIANKTHHVDVSGEPQYMERMQLEYHEAARENGVYIVSACGFDSIPADLGVVYLKEKFEGEINSIEVYLDSWCTNNVKKSGLHYGTWESAVYGLAHWNELAALRRALYPNKIPEFLPKKRFNFMIHKNRTLGKWCLPFPGSDRSVMKRTQRYFFEKKNERPIQVNTYIAFPNLFIAVCVLLFSAVFALLTRFKMGRTLLLKYPKFFSAGFASHEGPTEEQSENTHFSLTFFAEGWNEKMAEPTDKHLDPPTKTLVSKVTGTNPGYGATCVALILAGLSILKESDKMPDKGGVYPPGVAFADTRLIEHLNKFGVKFEIPDDDKKKTS